MRTAPVPVPNAFGQAGARATSREAGHGCNSPRPGTVTSHDPAPAALPCCTGPNAPDGGTMNDVTEARRRYRAELEQALARALASGR